MKQNRTVTENKRIRSISDSEISLVPTTAALSVFLKIPYLSR